MIGSILTVGAFAGASAGSQLLHYLGYKRVILLAAVIGLIASLVTHMMPFGYVAVVAMRLVLGIVSGIICVAAPTYVDIQSPQNLRDVAGCMFQISITLGIAITAVFGYILSVTDGVLTVFSLQVFLALSTLLSSALIAVSVLLMQPTPSSSTVAGTFVGDATASVVPIPDLSRRSSLGGSPTGVGLNDVELRQVRPLSTKSSPSLLPNVPQHDHHLDHLQHISKLSSLGGSSPVLITTGATSSTSALTFWSFGIPAIKQAFITVTVLLLVMQFTGINAIMNYAPRIAKSMGVPPMLGNAVIMTWNFLTTLIAVPLASRIPLRQLFLYGVIAASVGCGMSSFGSYLTGYEGGGVSPFASLISSVGIAVFIAGFETGMAPAAFVLVQRVYPSHLSGEAMGYYNAGQNLSAFLIVGSFPVLSDMLSSAFYATMSPSTTDAPSNGSPAVTTATVATATDTALSAATAYASCVLFGVFAVVGVVGWIVLKEKLP
jgi:MFS family permease